jgi:hypothetical protein
VSKAEEEKENDEYRKQVVFENRTFRRSYEQESTVLKSQKRRCGLPVAGTGKYTLSSTTPLETVQTEPLTA